MLEKDHFTLDSEIKSFMVDKNIHLQEPVLSIGNSMTQLMQMEQSNCVCGTPNPNSSMQSKPKSTCKRPPQ